MTKNDQAFIAQKIRAQYMEKGPSQLDELKKLDAKVRRPAVVFAYVFGIFGALVMGVGMCLAMEVLSPGSSGMIWGILIGLAGILIAILNYPIYKGILKSRRKKYADKIFSLSSKIAG